MFGPNFRKIILNNLLYNSSYILCTALPAAHNSCINCAFIFLHFQQQSPNIELLKRHKASRDAGIITQEEFMEIYHGIMNEGANIQQVSNSSSSSSQSNPTTAAASILKTQHQLTIINQLFLRLRRNLLSYNLYLKILILTTRFIFIRKE